MDRFKIGPKTSQARWVFEKIYTRPTCITPKPAQTRCVWVATYTNPHQTGSGRFRQVWGLAGWFGFLRAFGFRLAQHTPTC